MGADSIYFPQGGIINVQDMAGMQSSASGGRYSITGNLLTIVQHIKRDTSYNDGGEDIHITDAVTVSAVLEKQ